MVDIKLALVDKNFDVCEKLARILDLDLQFLRQTGRLLSINQIQLTQANAGNFDISALIYLKQGRIDSGCCLVTCD